MQFCAQLLPKVRKVFFLIIPEIIVLGEQSSVSLQLFLVQNAKVIKRSSEFWKSPDFGAQYWWLVLWSINLLVECCLE